jgi:diguanylate cyclase (GGDEF)-like protein
MAAHLQWIEVQTADYDQQGRRGRASYRHLAAAFAARRGDWRAVRELLLSLAGRPFSGPHDMKRDIWLDLARAHRALGDPVLAQAAAAEAAAEQARTGRLPRAVELQRLALLAELQGRADEALALAREHHRRVLANVLRAQEARIDALNDRLLAQALSSENQALRRRNEDLAADVRQASRLATTDALTGLANRRALLAQWPRLQALGVPLTLALLDVDHFKQINDRHSHAAGDAVLCALAQVMATTLREHDLLARWGGEEFALVLVGADAGEAAQALQRVCDRVRAHDWAGLVPGLRVTVSVGHVGAQPDQTLDAACARADVMLYRAKHQGRDRVVGAEPPAPEAAAASAEHAPSAQISPDPRPASAPPPACPP